MKVLRDYQSDANAAILAALATHKSTLLVMATGLGKAQPLDAQILTPLGFMPMESVRPGYMIVGGDGRLARVSGVFPQGTRKVFRVTFSDTTSTRCCADHLWNVQTKSQKCRGTGFRTMPLGEFMNDLRDGSEANKWFIPPVGPVEFPAMPLAIDPYAFGVLLGDGGLKYTIQLTTADHFIVEEMTSRLPTIHFKPDGKYGYVCGSDGHAPAGGTLHRAFKAMGLRRKGSAEKFIPPEYKYNSVAVRLMLVRGLMDTDGHVRKDGHAEFDSSSRRLADDFCDVIRSLGGCTHVRIKAPGRYTHKGEKRVAKGPSFRVTVALDGINPFLLPRKADVYPLFRTQGQTKAIVAVEPCGQSECQCLSVDNDSGLYVTDDYIVTHNSVCISKIANGWVNGSVLLLAHRIELVDQLASHMAGELGYKPSVEQGPRGLDPDSMFAAGHCVVGSIQSMITENRLRKFKKYPFGLIVIDEAHRATTASYVKLVERYREIDPECRLLGVTATPKRTDGTALGLVFESVAYEMGIVDGIDKGWLVDIHQKFALVEQLDLSKIPCKRNEFDEMDFQPAELEALLSQEGPLHAMSRPVIDCTENGEQAIIFAASVSHAHLWAAVLNHYRPGCAAAVDGTMLNTEGGQRQKIMKEYRAGTLQFLINFNIATEGFDAPNTSFVIMGRPTKSLLVYTQMLGRCTRPLPGIVDGLELPEARKDAIAVSSKPFATVLDFVGNSKHQVITATDVLGGTFDVNVREAADEIIGSQGEANVRDMLTKARASMLLEAEEERRRPMRNAVAGVKVAYRLVDRDPFGGTNGAPVPQTSRGGATDAQIAALVNLGVDRKTAEGYSRKQAGAVITSLRERRCTDKQAKTLKKFGLDPDKFNAEAASKQIQAIADKGWTWP